MVPSQIRKRIVAEKVGWIREMCASMRRLPLDTGDLFQSDPRNPAAAESYLRRAIEAVIDLHRHILAKGFGIAVLEYKEIASALVEHKVIDEATGLLLKRLAGHKNRLVHFYNEVSTRELYDICTTQIKDIEEVTDAAIQWIHNHPEKIDESL